MFHLSESDLCFQLDLVWHLFSSVRKLVQIEQQEFWSADDVAELSQESVAYKIKY